MSDENTFTLRQADLARGDFAAIADDLDFVKSQLARMPTRRGLLDMTILGMLWGAGIVLPHNSGPHRRCARDTIRTHGAIP